MFSVLFYTDTPMMGGTEEHMLTLATALPRSRFRVSLACSRLAALDEWCRRWTSAGLAVHRLRVLHKHDPRHFFLSRRLMAQSDLVHLHLWNPASCRYALAAVKNRPLVVTEHDPFPLHGFKKALKNLTAHKISRIIVSSHASRTIVVRAQPALKNKIITIPFGIDGEAWKKRALALDAATVRETIFGVCEKIPVILCVAELHERKGQEFLIEACKTLSSNGKRFLLVFVGDGSERSLYAKAAEELGDAVRFLGRQENVAMLMNAADVVVLPSRREAFGLVIVEAGVLEKPIVASNVGGIAEIIEDKKTGLLVPPETPRAIAEALIFMLDKPAEATAMGARAEAVMSTDFSAAAMAARTADLYSEVLEEYENNRTI